MELTPRLKKAADLIPHGSVLADVGTDHAYLPVYCVLNGISPYAAAMDINEGPLRKAEENVFKYGLGDKIELRLSNGIEKLNKGEADVIVIAGMGGLLIKNILDSGKGILDENTFLILQPMIAAEELREYLYQNGFCVENEYLAAEGNKLYNIITARYENKNSEYGEKDIFIGRNLNKNSPELYERYIKHKSEKSKKKINGLEQAKIRDDALITATKHELDVYKKELKTHET